MMCEFSEQLIVQALDGALTARERASLDAHLSACAACRRAWSEYALLARTADAWAREPSGLRQDDDFADRVWTRLTRRPEESLSRLRLGWFVAGAFAVAAACVGLGALLPPLPLPAPDARHALAFPSTARAVFDVSPWFAEIGAALSASCDAAVRTALQGYAMPHWITGALVVTTLLNLILFARVRRRAAS